ncbi:MAG: PH domain-containing protein [Actinomycetota bacterium]|nr:PH domain-containing protein [Actinomycetota bacterium]
MPFPTRLLLEGESVHVDLRPHWWYFVGPVAAGFPVVALGYAVLQLEGDVGQLAAWAYLALVLAWALWLGARLARWATTHFVVTSDRIVYRTGVLSKHGRDIPLERVNDITSNQTLFERMIGAGDLLIESAGERGQQTFSDIPHPDHVQHEIYRQMEGNAARALSAGVRPSPSAPATPSVPGQIAALADLRDRGAISEAEFEAKKAELLKRI